MLRQEVYALDGTVKAEHPYTVTEQNFTIRLLQPQGRNRHAVFFSHPREAISSHSTPAAACARHLDHQRAPDDVPAIRREREPDEPSRV